MNTTIKGIDELNKRLKMFQEKIAKFQSESGEDELPETVRDEMSRMAR